MTAVSSMRVTVSCARWVVTLKSRLKVRPILMMAQFRWRAPEQWCAAEGFGPSRRLAPGPSTEPSEGPMPRSCVYQFRHARVEQSIGDKLTTIQLQYLKSRHYAQGFETTDTSEGTLVQLLIPGPSLARACARESVGN